MSAETDTDALTGRPVGKLIDSTPAGWPEAKLLTGRTVRLETLNSALHADALWDAVGGEDNAALWLYMSEGPFTNRSDFDVHIENVLKQDDPVFFAIVDLQTGRAVGWCALLNIRPKHRSVEIGHLLFSTRLQRTVGATEALYLLSRYAFDDLGYRRYEWKCNALNAKSRTAAERFGFVFEGVFRQHMIIKGRNRDSAWFSMTAEEWPPVRFALENWLASENFDDAGHQKKSLRAKDLPCHHKKG